MLFLQIQDLIMTIPIHFIIISKKSINFSLRNALMSDIFQKDDLQKFGAAVRIGPPLQAIHGCSFRNQPEDFCFVLHYTCR